MGKAERPRQCRVIPAAVTPITASAYNQSQ